MKIKNIEELSKNDLRKSALAIAEVGLQSIDTKDAIKRSVKLSDHTLTIHGENFKLDSSRKIFVVGVGKCSLDAAEALEEILDSWIYKGMVIDIRGNPDLKHIKSCEGDHPFPSQRNVDLTSEMIEMLKEVSENDLVIAIISGGGSTLLCNPVNFTCQDEIAIIQCLFRGGATIQEVNTVRKHLSAARGGNLAKAAYPATVRALIFSDVVGDEIPFIASGPTSLDTTTVNDAKAVMEKYDVIKRCSFLEDNLIETPKEEKYFEKVHNTIIVSNEIALHSMKKKAEELGFRAHIKTSRLLGEASLKGEQIAKELHHAGSNAALLYGGETIVRLKGSGTGGRNQELALGALLNIKEDECLIALASDGRDNSDSAGTICDTISLQEVKKLKLNPKDSLDRNDSFPFWLKLKDQIMTGPTGSNVADFVIALKR